MKRLLLLLTLIALSTGCFAEGAGAEESADRLQKIEAYLDEITQAYHVPGMAVVITSPDNQVFEKVYGQCTSLDQQFYIGSMSKSYTALCIMQLVEKGLVQLKDDISVYLPEYKFEKPVTVLALLNQTSGFDTHSKLADGKKLKPKKTYGKYEYANVNYDLLGKIVEAASGLSYEEYIQKNVFGPLGMSDSKANAWAVKDSPKLLLGNRNYFGFFKRGEAVFPVEKSWFHEPAGYIACTPNDHAKYLRMYLNEGLQILSPEGIQKMWFKNVSEGDNQFDAYYGMGWNYMNWNGQPMLFHGGQVENGITFQYILPEKKLAVCFMINASDYLVMNNLMNGVIFDSIAILNGGESGTVNHKTWLLLHLALNAIYLVLIGLSVFVLIMAIKARLNLVFKIVGCVLWPVLLLSFLPLFLSTPLWVVRLYVPDLFLVIITSAAIAFAGGVITCVRFLRRR